MKALSYRVMHVTSEKWLLSCCVVRATREKCWQRLCDILDRKRYVFDLLKKYRIKTWNKPFMQSVYEKFVWACS